MTGILSHDAPTLLDDRPDCGSCPTGVGAENLTAAGHGGQLPGQVHAAIAGRCRLCGIPR